jgi:hypothetical protein
MHTLAQHKQRIMKNLYLILSGFALCTVITTGCQKEKDPVVTGQPFSFISLTSEDEKLSVGETTTVHAEATGDGLIYIWSTNSGDIIGSGATITYGGSNCCVGTNTVTCTVKDMNGQEETKSVTVKIQ